MCNTGLCVGCKSGCERGIPCYAQTGMICKVSLLRSVSIYSILVHSLLRGRTSLLVNDLLKLLLLLEPKVFKI